MRDRSVTMRLALPLAALVTLTSCDVQSMQIEPLPDGEVTYLWQTLPIRRRIETFRGVSTERWAVFYNTTWIRCPQPTEQSCYFALREYDYIRMNY